MRLLQSQHCTFLFIVCFIGAIALDTESEEDETQLENQLENKALSELKIQLESMCKDYCMVQLKEAEICDKFCEFVEHIVENHGEKLLQQLEGTQQRSEPLKWAMEDIVRLRVSHHIEDNHQIGNWFFESVTKWGAYLLEKDEL